jgi:predicted nuclease of predicted toxin-antitoxin system
VHILLDECVNAGLRAAFPGHAVRTVAEIGWRGSPDGPLLTYAQAHFDVFVTIDRNLEHQQNLRKLNLGFVIIRVPSNEITSYCPLFSEVQAAAENVRAGEVVHVVSAQIRT